MSAVKQRALLRFLFALATQAGNLEPGEMLFNEASRFSERNLIGSFALQTPRLSEGSLSLLFINGLSSFSGIDEESDALAVDVSNATSNSHILRIVGGAMVANRDDTRRDDGAQGSVAW